MKCYKVHDEARTVSYLEMELLQHSLEGILAVYIKRLKNVYDFVLAIIYLEIYLREFSEIRTRICTSLFLKMLFIIVKNVKVTYMSKLREAKIMTHLYIEISCSC